MPICRFYMAAFTSRPCPLPRPGNAQTVAPKENARREPGVCYYGNCRSMRLCPCQAAAANRLAVAPWAMMVIEARALADVPPQALQSAHVVRLPASSLAGQTTSAPLMSGASAARTRNVRHPPARASCACASLSTDAMHSCANCGNSRHWIAAPHTRGNLFYGGLQNNS